MSDYPHIRRVSAYFFFAICAISVAVMASVGVDLLGWRSWAQNLIGNGVMIFVFLTLRDMTAKSAETVPQQGVR